MKKDNFIDFLNEKVRLYNQPSFIAGDPVSVPHHFHKKQDIEIAAFFAAVFAWGKRSTIINKANELMRLMDDAPFAFCTGHTDNDLKKLLSFKHRTFNTTDLLYFIEFFKWHYSKHKSLETAFTMHGTTIEEMLTGFPHYFFSLEDAPPRTRKHIASPEKGSTCKRLNMFLRWMVRRDKQGVDFGIWKKISPAQLICPVDLHVARVADRFGLIDIKDRQNPVVDWKTAVMLTDYLRTLDPDDPVKYDFALFGMGVMEKY